MKLVKLQPSSAREWNLWRLAIHEAGHAVIAVIDGATTGHVSIGDASDGNRGRCAMSGQPDRDSSAMIVALAIVTLAGDEAERLFGDNAPAIPPVRALSRITLPASPSSDPSPYPSEWREPPNDAAIIWETARVALLGTPEARNDSAICAYACELIDRARDAVGILLRRHERAVRSVALELINAGIASADRVRELLNTADREAHAA